MTADGRALILCVDEYESILMGWKALLEQEGYQVLTAAACNDAFRLFSSEPIDQVMLDSQLPGMPGDAIAAHMKQINPDVPILLFSEAEPMPRERLTTVDAFLPKSEPIIVLATLKTLLARPKTTVHVPDAAA
jgi:CheY-like chemotaxis protein